MKGVINSNLIVFIAVYTLFPWSCVRTGTEDLVGLILTLVVAEDCATDSDAVFVMVFSNTVVSNVDVTIIGDWKKTKLCKHTFSLCNVSH